MRIEVRCPDCDRAWLIDQSSAGGEMVCTSCLTRIDLSASRVAQAVAATATAPTDVEPEPAAAATVEPPEEIVCPRCNLHFSPRTRPEVEPVGERKTVLVIEDLEYFRQVATDALASAYEVKTAGSSSEGRSLIAAGGIDLIVLDLTLDGGDEGHQLLRELQPKPCPVLIFTAQDESEMYGDRWDELTRLGADDLVIKGMNVGESLLRKVGALLGSPVENDDAMDAMT